MTEKEAIKILADFDLQVAAKADVAYQTTMGKMACDMAIQALEEIQQYREIGTVEELKNQKHNLGVAYKIISDYEAIGTVEECRAAVEKQKSKKVFIIAASKIVCKGSYVFYKCPVCREQICSGFYYPPLDTYLGEKQYCENCGQAIDWSEED